jgi:response regulator RpfG family c-di-GMP phosphodiesterase
LKDNPVTNGIPVVIVTALNDVPNQLKSIDAGADDFLSKPIEEKLLIAKVKLLSNLNISSKKAIHYEKLIKDAIDGLITVDDLQEKIIS